MCPACFATIAALVAKGAASSGGLTALAIKVRRARKNSKQPATMEPTSPSSQPSGRVE